MPRAGAGEVIIKVEVAGIRPTDLRKYMGVSKVKEPIILGPRILRQRLRYRRESFGLEKGGHGCRQPIPILL